MMKIRPTLVFVCNALDDETRLERGIESDSPAASRKVFLLCGALRRVGIRALVLSLGRGRTDGSGRYFRTTVKRVSGVPTIYAPFLQRRWASEALSLVGLIPALWRLRSQRSVTVLFYNRVAAYTPSLLCAVLLRYRTVLDFEDGEVDRRGGPIRALARRVLQRYYDTLCSGGALLACRALASTTKLRPVQCYYGVHDGGTPTHGDWDAPELVVLLGGTLSRDTGAELLAEAIREMSLRPAPCNERLRFVITGKGDGIASFADLATSNRGPRVVIRGRTTDAEFREILAGAHVGLSLKLTTGLQAYTTFPSKVIEMAGAGLLVVTTDISDVRAVLGEGALYLERESPAALGELLRWITENRAAAARVARRGTDLIRGSCAPAAAAESLKSFLFGEAA